VECFVFGQTGEMGGENVPYRCALSGQFVQTAGDLFGMCANHRRNEVIPRGEMNEYRPVSHPGALGHIDRAGCGDPSFGHEVEGGFDQQLSGLLLPVGSAGCGVGHVDEL
jgi:hypothetical protein